jgi:hypothetical protein
MKTEGYIHYDVERMKALSIKRVASHFGTLKYSGTSCMALCPWHDDHHPSLSLVESAGKNYCHCFSCGKGGDVITYVMAALDVDFREACEWLSSKYGILTSDDKSFVPQKKQRSVEETDVIPPSDYIPMEMLEKLVTVENPLCQCLMHIFHPEAVKWVTEEYRLGCYTLSGDKEYTVFPNIDVEGHVCNLKVQPYDTDILSSRFAHSPKKSSYWLASIWKRHGKLPSNGQYHTHNLFGEHLLPLYPARTIALVESPKNAIVGALENPQMVWVATGNKLSLQRKYLEPLRGRDVIVIPDCDAVEEWKKTTLDMKDLANFTVSDFCQRVAPRGEPKYDIADYIINRRREGI